MKLYLVRHAMTDEYLNRVNQGWLNNPINKQGIMETEALGKKVKAFSIQQIYSGDLLRGKMTTGILNKYLNKTVAYDSRLRDITSGDLDGKRKSDIAPEILNDFMANPKKYHAESYEDVYNRTKSFLDELKTKKFDAVMIVSNMTTFSFFRYCLEEKSWDLAKYKAKCFASIGHSEYMMIEI